MVEYVACAVQFRRPPVLLVGWGKGTLRQPRMRAAIAALPFETPRLSLNANVESKDFAERLEGAIKRSGVRPLVIEHSWVQAPRGESL